MSARRTVEVALGTSGLDAHGMPIRAPLTGQGAGACAWRAQTLRSRSWKAITC
ncbi:MAG: hypothetical protein IPP90_17300 [Gemmatimonadaceae bacterium]|nr:hypothetical protein [Gemmatimonadaceae bacterium]